MNARELFCNELLFSDSSSDESDDYNFANEIIERDRHSIPKITEFEDVVDKFTDGEFRKHFRMYRTTFSYIINLIENKISSNIIDVGRHTIPAKIQLLITIWYFATPDSYRSLCNRFNIGNATGLRTVRRVTDALLEICPNFIKWPSQDYVNEVAEDFNRMGFPNTIGCIDGSYIPIPLPSGNGIPYVCRKNFPAIILQGVCDHRMLFTHCYAGEAGSVHDARVLKNSEIWPYLTQQAAEKFPRNTHLIGDKAYPCMETLLTPYKDNGHLTRNQLNYNYKLSCARSTIERAFGLLKKRMRCLKMLDVRSIKWIPKYIIACCVLHNICILQNDVMHVELNEEDIEEFVNVNLNDDVNRRLRGIDKRNYICEQLARN